MAEKSKKELLDTKVGKCALRDWDTMWKELPDAYHKQHPELRHVVGLFRTKLNGTTMYIARATESPGGIAKGLRRIAGPKQTGNSAYGAQKIKKHIDFVTVDILSVDQTLNPSAVTKQLKSIMVKYHDPEWNRPHSRRIKTMNEAKKPQTL